MNAGAEEESAVSDRMNDFKLVEPKTMENGLYGCAEASFMHVSAGCEPCILPRQEEQITEQAFDAENMPGRGGTVTCLTLPADNPVKKGANSLLK